MQIKLGYQIGTGKEIKFEPSHMMVTGITDKSGKTTTLEALIHQSKKKVIVFKTKRGEKVFQHGNFIEPYFKDRSDWEFVKSIIEAILRGKVGYLEKIEIIKICQESGDSLFGFKQIVDDKLSGKTKKKLSNFESNILVGLQAYLEKALIKLKDIPFSDELILSQGLNIIDLGKFAGDDAILSLIISSVAKEVHTTQKNTVVVIPEAWRFLPQDRNNPCKLPVEELIRQGATNGNFVWLDSQDIAGVDKAIIKQVTEYILGYQAERNEVKHTIDQIPLPKNQKPKPEEIMNLGKGEFLLASRDLKVKVFVQPVWLDDETAIRVATGSIKVSDIETDKLKKNFYEKEKLKQIKPTVQPKQPVTISQPSPQISESKPTPSLISTPKSEPELPPEIITDESLTYIDKMIGGLQREIDQIKEKLRTKPSHDEVINQIVARIPKATSGTTVYEIAPLEAIKKKFLQEAKDKIISDVSNLSKDAKKLLKYLESRAIGIALSEVCIKCFFMKSGGGGYAQQVKSWASELIEIQVLKKQTNGKYLGVLKDRIIELVKANEATDEEIENLYNHILTELLGEKIEAK